MYRKVKTEVIVFLILISILFAVAAPNLLVFSADKSASVFFANSLGQDSIKSRLVNTKYVYVPKGDSGSEIKFLLVRTSENLETLPFSSVLLVDSTKGEVLSQGQRVGTISNTSNLIAQEYGDGYVLDLSSVSDAYVVGVAGNNLGLSEASLSFYANSRTVKSKADAASAYRGLIFPIDSKAPSEIDKLINSKQYVIATTLNSYVSSLPERGKSGLTDIVGYLRDVLNEGGLSAEIKDSLMQIQTSFVALKSELDGGNISSVTSKDISFLSASVSGLAVISSAGATSLNSSLGSSMAQSSSSLVGSESISSQSEESSLEQLQGASAGIATNSSYSGSSILTSAASSIVLPKKASVGKSANISACDSTEGFYTHPLQDKNCVLANTFSIPIGSVLSLSYSSRRTDSGFFGLSGFRTNFYSYISKDLTYFIGQGSEKVKLIRSGSALKRANFLWGDSYIFTIVNSQEITRKVGDRVYTYKKQVDNNYHLTNVADSESSLIEITFQTSYIKNSRNELAQSPELKSVKYKNQEGVFEIVEINTQVAFLQRNSLSQYVIPPQITVNYPGDQSDYSFFVGKSGSVEVLERVMRISGSESDLEFEFQYAGSYNYPVARTTYIKDQEPSSTFYGYDSIGHLIYLQNGQDDNYHYDVTFPATKNYQSVQFLNNYKIKTSYGYKAMCNSALVVASSNQYGNSAYRYAGADCYSQKTWDPRLGWGAETTKHTENEKIVKNTDGSLTSYKKTGNTSVYTTSQGKVTHTSQDNGSYKTISEVGSQKTEESLTVNGDSRVYESKVFQANKLISNNKVTSNEGVQLSENLITGEKSQSVSTDTSFEQTYSSPQSATYKQITNSNDQGSKTTYYKDDKVYQYSMSNSDGSGEKVEKQSGSDWWVKETWSSNENESRYNRSYVK